MIFFPRTSTGKIDKGVVIHSLLFLSSLQVWTSFYHSQYDWSLIFREIGEQGGNGSSTSSMFYKTRHTLARHAELDKSWAPRNETLLAR